MEPTLSIRKLAWKAAKDEAKEAWVLDYVNQAGKRHIKTFARKKDAADFSTTILSEVRDGTHTDASQSIRVWDAGDRWIATAEKNGLERSRVDQYRHHPRLHINPNLARLLF